MKIDREFWNGKRIFITGGTGFIGSHLTSKLVSLGAIVKLFTHNEYPENKELIGFDGDLTYAYLHYRQFLLEYKPEIVCFLGKGTYRKFKDIGNNNRVDYGYQKEPIGQSKVFVAVFPSSMDRKVEEKIELLKKIHNL